ncbi:MAG TPA: protein kinase [Archangium sp.]|uniref:protein kinase domain-containing protein n=1 Tax=Archangium sp. TaxID=1872627 RepID=UPI002E344459|nr:protein kinase [Archangium sp.]HEX5749428.1 protein kinase [Archangium sp.]
MDDKTAPAPATPPGTLPKGTVIAGRFILESLAGRGGMGFVYRATDSSTGGTVALKLLNGATSPEVAYRFKREAVLLAELRHPGIVAYVAHGSTEAHQPYLAMEWLEGEVLSHRLARQPLGLPETLSLLRRAAEALTTAHQQGIVHRDLKPSNLFLRGGRPEEVVLLDFGLARYVTRTLVAVTGTGAVVGTPGYMAPEQASSAPEIPPAADIFSLGCVLYECLTGRPPFAAPHFAATLAKILYAEPARLEVLRPGLPAGLQVLVDRMLAKDPRQRLADAPRLVEALGALESVPELLLPRAGAEPRFDSGVEAEQKLVSVLLVSLAAGSQEETSDWNLGVALRDSLRRDLAPLQGAQAELLADGSLVATLAPERGTATDQAALAARCALTLKERWPEAAVVLTTGLGVFNERMPVGEAMDRAGRLLRQLERTPSANVVMDDVTAGLLGPGFQLSRSDSGTFVLRGEQLEADASRPLLGKPTHCVGREQELALLDFTFTTCVEESAARALLVTASPGTGKSRLRHEFLRRLEGKEQPPLVLLGRGDPMSTGASYGLLGQALRRLCAVGQGESLEARRTRLYQRVARHLPEAKAQEVVEFLGELCAIPFPEEESPRLRAARGDPQLMSTQVGRALGAFLKAECAHQPVLLVLEDLHWSDALTVTLVDGLLRELAGQPFLVLALARPEVKQLFPGLWARRLQEVPLQGLSRKACGRLVREVLGPRVSESVVQRAVEQSDGNALFLEELIRMAAEGRGEKAPETVLAVLQARLLRMVHGERQVLLAASIFGRVFWLEGVGELLGHLVEPARLEQHLRVLVEQEVIEPLPDSHFATATEYRFRHALVRDAAYGLVPEGQRPLGHQRAGAWLERMGEPDELVLATHFQWGQQLERAASFYTRAAERLFERNNMQETLRCVEAAVACGVSGEGLARLQALQAMVLFWRAQMSRALELGVPALAGLKAGSPLWCRLMGSLIFGGASSTRPDVTASLGELLVRTTPEPKAVEAYLEAIALMGAGFMISGERQKVEAMLGRLMEVGADVMAHSPLARGIASLLKGHASCFFESSPWRLVKLAEQGERDFSAVGSERNTIVMQTLLGFSLGAMGERPSAVEVLRKSLGTARRTEQHLLVETALLDLSLVLADRPEAEDRREAHAGLLELMARESGYLFIPGVSHALLARMTADGGALSEAESLARKACELLVPFLVYRVYARTVLSGILRAQGRAVEAREVAELGVSELARMGSEGVFAVGMRLALAEACFAQGDASAGEEALREALRCVRARASDIPEPEARERFLRQVPENARTLELAHQRWGEAVA